MKRLVIGLLSVLLFGCGVKTAQAPRENLRPKVELGTFTRQSWRLVNNKFFLWRDDMTPEHASRAIAIGREIDDLDGQALPLNRRHLDLDNKISPLKDATKALSTRIRGIKTEQDRNNKKKTDTQKSITQVQEKLKIEKDKPQPDPAQVAALQRQLDDLNGALTAVNQKLAELAAARRPLEQELAKQKAILDPLQSEMDALEAEQLVIEEAGRKKVDEIMTVVEWYKDQPTAVSFQFERDGSISAGINGWNLGDDAGPRNFSTQSIAGRKPTMANVTYTELGGIFEFDVYVYADEDQTQLRETYHFRVGRIKYDYPDGRIFFGGEMSRTASDGTVRRGLAKLVDRNN